MPRSDAVPIGQTPAPAPAPAPAPVVNAAPTSGRSAAVPIDQSAPPPAAAPSDTGPGFFSVEGQLGPLAPLFGYKQRTPVDTPGQVLQHAADVGRVAVDQVPFAGKLVDAQGAEDRLKGTAYQGAGEVLGGTALSGATEALGAGRAIAGAAKPYVGGLLSRLIGGGLEQGTIAGAGTAGHGGSAEDVAKSFGTGSLIGAITGPGGTKEMPNTPTTGDLLAEAESKLQPLKNITGNPKAVANTLTNARDAMSSGDFNTMKPGLKSKLDEIINDVNNRTVITADDVAKHQRSLMNAARGKQDQLYAGNFNRALDGTLGQYAGQVADANRSMNIAKTSRDIEGWMAQGDKAPSVVASTLAKKPGLYQAQPGLFDALSDVGNMKPSWWQNAGNEIINRGVKGALGAGVGYLTGGNIGEDILLAGIGGATGNGYRPLGPPIKNSLAAARHLAATGQKLPPGAFSPPSETLQSVLDAVRQGTYGLGATGRLP